MGDCRPEFSRVQLMGEGVDWVVVEVTPYLVATMVGWHDSYHDRTAVGMGRKVN